MTVDAGASAQEPHQRLSEEIHGGVDAFHRLVRAVLPRSDGQKEPSASEPLIRAHRAIHPKGDISLLRRAYAIADEMHAGQHRLSGEPYVTHPLAVSQILAELGMDTVTLVAALLHDTVEDTSYTLEKLRADFSTEIAYLVDGVTKLDGMYWGEAAEAETIRKLVVAAGRDVRVLIIKLADRLHNMRTLRFKSPQSQLRIARATREVLVPLADRLGINVVKRQLEDLSLAVLEPAAYARIDRYARNRRDRIDFMNAVIEQVRAALRDAKVHALVTPRPRHYTSIFQEMSTTPTHEPYDPPRLVISVSGPVNDCYAALGAVHGTWRPVPGRFKDFIASPKFNLYQSLHTTVIGPGDEPLEVLIRTEAMHKTAEYGIVAQFRDRGTPGTAGADPCDELEWLRRLLSWQRDAVNPTDFLDSLHYDLSEHQILVFTTRGEQVLLPAEATPVDLAYTLDTGIGDRLIGAYVNGKLVPLSSTLGDGDVVEIITAHDDGDYPGPSREWLLFVKSPQAHLQINQWFAGRAEEQAAVSDKVASGRAAIKKALLRYERGLSSEAPLTRVARQLGYPDLGTLFVAVSDGQLSASSVVEQLIAHVDDSETAAAFQPAE